MHKSSLNFTNLKSCSPNTSPIRFPTFHQSIASPLKRKPSSENEVYESPAKKKIDFFQQENIEPIINTPAYLNISSTGIDYGFSSMSLNDAQSEPSRFFINSSDKPLNDRTSNFDDTKEKAVKINKFNQVGIPISYSEPALKAVQSKCIIPKKTKELHIPSELIEFLLPTVDLIIDKINSGESYPSNEQEIKYLNLDLLQPFKSIWFFSSIIDGLYGQMHRYKYYETLISSFEEVIINNKSNYITIGKNLAKTIEAFTQEISHYPKARNNGNEKNLFLKSVQVMNSKLRELDKEIKNAEMIESINIE